jgi:DNA polymerase-3 subunit gamma/tau
MTYQALARKWRPRQFADLVGQEHVLRALVHALDSERLHHAYLFTGTRGVGKTTIARIFAKALNCETGVSSSPCGECAACRDIDDGRFVDLIEVDAASRTKVDDTRELLENVQYTPTRGRYKVYLIDEVHMLSGHSFNALLKTLEEPPPHVKFLFATTDPQRLPVTVLSRCLQFNLKRLPESLIEGRLEEVTAAEEIATDAGALELIARAADGSLRDALSLLDQAAAFGNGRLDAGEIGTMLGTIEQGHIQALVEAVSQGDAAALLAEVAEMDQRAPDYVAALDQMAALTQKIAIAQWVPDAVDDASALKLADAFAPEDVQLNYDILVRGKRDLDLAPSPRLGFEMVLLRLLAFAPDGRLPARAPDGKAGRQRSAGRPEGKEKTPTPKAVEAGRSEALAGKVREAASEEDETGDWATLLEALPLKGMARQLAANCRLIDRSASAVHLELDPAHEHLLTGTLKNRLGEALERHAGGPVRLRIDVGGDPGDTPARRQEAREIQRQKQAEASIQADPNVRAMQDMFGATIEPDSIRPVGPDSTETDTSRRSHP